ncbi:MAG: hypothetical protein H6644_02805 [Caldilineaceae bacterium]|nr:hypothetical protein [Caldilineaceae bacterium]
MKTMIAYYGVSDDLAEVTQRTYAASAWEIMSPCFSMGTYIQQKVIELYNNLGRNGFVAGVAALAIVALVMAVTTSCLLTVHNTGCSLDLCNFSRHPPLHIHGGVQDCRR